MSEIECVINQFFENLKNEFIDKEISKEFKKKDKQKKKLDDTAIAKLRVKFQAEADKQYVLKEWFEKAKEKVKPYLTTHPAKFTNAKITNETSKILFYGKLKNDGYVKSGNVNIDNTIDVSGNANANTIIFELYSLLKQKIKDGRTITDLFKEDYDDLVSFINQLMDKKLYLEVKENFLSILKKNDSQSTDGLIRQVYFPLKDQYHLLSIFTASLVMFEMKKRIKAYDKWVEGNHIRTFKRDHKFYEGGFDEIYNLTEIGFCNTDYNQMRNFSYLNAKNQGIAYLLPSSPPPLKNRKITLPSKNFFTNSLIRSRFKDNFIRLHELMQTPINNMHVRQAIENVINYVIDNVLERAFMIRAFGEGWSTKEHYQKLPLDQRIWLDDLHKDQREKETDWIDSVAQSCTHWFIQSYEKTLKDNKIMTGEVEFSHIKEFVSQTIERDKGVFK